MILKLSGDALFAHYRTEWMGTYVIIALTELLTFSGYCSLMYKIFNQLFITTFQLLYLICSGKNCIW